MQIKYTIDAFTSLAQLINFVESKNTSGAGIRWLDQYEKHLQNVLINAKQKKPCHNATFNRLNLLCIYYNDWVIAFSIHSNFILIEALMHKSRISD